MILKTLWPRATSATPSAYPVDEIITTGKSFADSERDQGKIMARMEAGGSGVQLVNITIQDAGPPTAEVLTAFKEVETAKQGKEKPR